MVGYLQDSLPPFLRQVGQGCLLSVVFHKVLKVLLSSLLLLVALLEVLRHLSIILQTETIRLLSTTEFFLKKRHTSFEKENLFLCVLGNKS